MDNEKELLLLIKIEAYKILQSLNLLQTLEFINPEFSLACEPDIDGKEYKLFSTCILGLIDIDYLIEKELTYKNPIYFNELYNISNKHLSVKIIENTKRKSKTILFDETGKYLK